MTHITLHLGDCLNLLPFLPNQSVDMVLCDLPYGTTRNSWDTPLPLPLLWAEYERVCKGPVVLFAQTPFDKILGASNIQDLRYEWIWEKNRPTGFLNAKRAPLKSHENILVFSKNRPPYFPQGLTPCDKMTYCGTGSSNYGGFGNTSGKYLQQHTGYPRSVLKFPSLGTKQHPTQKPVSLLEYLIRTYSEEDAVVLDNTMGGGSTGVAARNTGRRFIGMEKDPRCFAVAWDRLFNIVSN